LINQPDAKANSDIATRQTKAYDDVHYMVQQLGYISFTHPIYLTNYW